MPTINKPPKRNTYKKHGKNLLISKIYNSSNWVKLRESYIMEHPLCEHCLKEGIIEPATEVHHKFEISNGKDEMEMKEIAYNANNLESLCTKCHHNEHNKRRKA